jgi:hypothetical protein
MMMRRRMMRGRRRMMRMRTIVILTRLYLPAVVVPNTLLFQQE